MSTSSLRDMLDQAAEAWRPEPGDIVVGHIIGIDSRDGGYGPYPIYTLQQEDGSVVALHCFHTALRNELDGKVTEGDEVAIRFDGRKTKKSGEGSYWAYTTRVRRAGVAAVAPAAAVAPVVETVAVVAAPAAPAAASSQLQTDDDLPF